MGKAEWGGNPVCWWSGLYFCSICLDEASCTECSWWLGDAGSCIQVVSNVWVLTIWYSLRLVLWYSRVSESVLPLQRLRTWSLSQVLYSTEDVKCWGLLRTTALEPGVEAPSVIRTLILRTCLQTPDMSRATGMRATRQWRTRTQSGKVETWVWIPLSPCTPGRSSTHCRNSLSQLSSKHLKVKPDLYVSIWYLQLLLNYLSSSGFLAA